MTIDEIMALPVEARINELKDGRGWRREPDTEHNMDAWFIERHDVMNEKLNPDKEIVIEKAKIVTDSKGRTYKKDAKKEKQPVNRIALPIEQDIVNIQTAFTVGSEPMLNCQPNDDEEKALLAALKLTMRKNRIKFLNKKEVRAWLSEQEVAEYWYVVDDTDGVWRKFVRKVKSWFVGATQPKKRLKCEMWSPFRGDRLWPYFDGNDLVAFMREYKKKHDGTMMSHYMIITPEVICTIEPSGKGWKETTVKHGFKKMPICYMYRPKPYCDKIRKMRERTEKTLSSYADCVDYHFFPYLVLYGDVKNVGGRLKNHVIEMHGTGASASYLTWNQVPETIKFETDTYFEMMYSMTNTPRISFEQLKGSAPPSGTSWHYYFIGAEMAVRNHEEVVGEFIQRRINFLVSAIGDMNVSLSDAAETIDIETEIVPYTIDDIDSRVNTAIKAKDARVWSNQHAMRFIGNIDHIDEELKEIMDEMRSDQQMEIDKAVAIAQSSQSEEDTSQ